MDADGRVRQHRRINGYCRQDDLIRNERGTWEGGKGRGKLCNYAVIKKMKCKKLHSNRNEELLWWIYSSADWTWCREKKSVKIGQLKLFKLKYDKEK